ncbi:MAG: PEP-CTERM/exosortase system-associated acyltransferase [Burkholderiales bacterium]
MAETASTEGSPACDNFARYFEIVPTLTPALLDEVYSIRHQVFCEDLGFEATRPDRRENDEYDAQSLHLLIRSVNTGEYVGCTRIVRVRPEDAQSRMPFERICAHAIDRTIVDPAALPRATIGEVSRLSIIAKYRKRKGELKQPAAISSDDFGTQGHPRFPYIMVGLYFGAVELARLHGIETLFFLTEPRLAEHFRKLGVEIRTIGAAIEHRGTRIPSMMNTGTILENLKTMLRPMYLTIAKEVDAAFPALPVMPVMRA